MKLFLSLLLLFTFQSEWIEKIDKSIKHINEKGILETEFEKKDKDGKTVFAKYIIEKEIKTNIQYKYGRLMDIDVTYYENCEILFAELTKGKDVLIYKRERRKDEPYAVLIERRTYFKNETEGVRKTKKIQVYENSDVERLKKELEQIDFKTEIIGKNEYQNLKEKYNRIKNLKE